MIDFIKLYSNVKVNTDDTDIVPEIGARVKYFYVNPARIVALYPIEEGGNRTRIELDKGVKLVMIDVMESCNRIKELVDPYAKDRY